MSRRPKVAVLTSYFPTRDEHHRGHSAYQTLRQMTDLADIEVVCTTARYPESKLLRPRGFVARDVDLTWSPPDVKAHYTYFKAIPLVSRVLNGYACLRAAKPFLDQINPDVILNYWLYPEGWAAVKWGQDHDIPVIVGSIGSDLRRIDDAVTRQYTVWTLEHASAILTVSYELADQAVTLGAERDKVRVVVNGCDTQVFHPRDQTAMRAKLGLEQDAEWIVYVGNVIPTKGLFELLDAFTQLEKERPRVRLAMIGRGQSLEPLQFLAAERGLSSKVLLPGVAASERVAEWMAASDLFCLPSYSEGCPNVVIEALACGRPVVGTLVGGIPELVDDQNGVLVKLKDVADLKRGLAEALDRPWDHAALATRHNRNWRQAAEDTFALCQQVLSAKSTTSNDGSKVAPD